MACGCRAAIRDAAAPAWAESRGGSRDLHSLPCLAQSWPSPGPGGECLGARRGSLQWTPREGGNAAPPNRAAVRQVSGRGAVAQRLQRRSARVLLLLAAMEADASGAPPSRSRRSPFSSLRSMALAVSCVQPQGCGGMAGMAKTRRRKLSRRDELSEMTMGAPIDFSFRNFDSIGGTCNINVSLRA